MADATWRSPSNRRQNAVAVVAAAAIVAGRVAFTGGHDGKNQIAKFAVTSDKIAFGVTLCMRQGQSLGLLQCFSGFHCRRASFSGATAVGQSLEVGLFGSYWGGPIGAESETIIITARHSHTQPDISV